MKKPNAQGIAYRIWRYLYTIILMLCLPVLLLLMRKKLKMPSINTDMPHRSFKERLGLVSASFQSGGLLIHCASVGEINAGQGLIRDLLASYPHLTITLCCSSTTGAVHAFNLFKNKVQHHYLPFDLPLSFPFVPGAAAAGGSCGFPFVSLRALFARCLSVVLPTAFKIRS